MCWLYPDMVSVFVGMWLRPPYRHVERQGAGRAVVGEEAQGSVAETAGGKRARRVCWGYVWGVVVWESGGCVGQGWLCVCGKEVEEDGEEWGGL